MNKEMDDFRLRIPNEQMSCKQRRYILSSFRNEFILLIHIAKVLRPATETVMQQHTLGKNDIAVLIALLAPLLLMHLLCRTTDFDVSNA